VTAGRTVNGDEDSEFIRAVAEICARHVVGARGNTPYTRNQWGSDGLEGPEPVLLDADEILDQRRHMLASVEQHHRATTLPQTVHILTSDGAIHPLPADRANPDQLLAAQVAEAASALVLTRAIVATALRMSALERLRVLAESLDQLTAPTEGR
jgi:hypothetical protein